jgi:hypothetical protein
VDSRRLHEPRQEHLRRHARRLLLGRRRPRPPLHDRDDDRPARTRLLARRTGIPFRCCAAAKLGDQISVARREIALLNYGATVVTDWTPRQVATDIRATRTNVAIIDLLHGFHYSDERQLSEFIAEFAAAATTDAGVPAPARRSCSSAT